MINSKLKNTPEMNSGACIRVLMQSLMGETTAVAHGGNHGSRSWGKPPRPRCLPKTALPPQDRTASPRPRCIACQKLKIIRLYLFEFLSWDFELNFELKKITFPLINRPWITNLRYFHSLSSVLLLLNPIESTSGNRSN